MADPTRTQDNVLDEIAKIRENIGRIRENFTDQELLVWYTQQAQKARSRVNSSAPQQPEGLQHSPESEKP